MLQAQAAAAVRRTPIRNWRNVTNFREDHASPSRAGKPRQNADNAVGEPFEVQTAGIANAQAGIAVAVANLKAQQATVDRLHGAERRSSAWWRPFDGVITARNVDTGDLLTQDSSGGAPMFSIVRDDVLRIAVYVPQSSANRHP